MKIGSRVQFRYDFRSPGLVGTVTGLDNGLVNGLVTVRWNGGPTITHDADVLVESEREPFPYCSHRTMAQVSADEQKPEPA